MEAKEPLDEVAARTVVGFLSIVVLVPAWETIWNAIFASCEMKGGGRGNNCDVGEAQSWMRAKKLREARQDKAPRDPSLP